LFTGHIFSCCQMEGRLYGVGFHWRWQAVLILVLMAFLVAVFIRPAPYGVVEPIYFGLFPAPWFYVLLSHLAFAGLLGLLAFKFDLYDWVTDEVLRKEDEQP